MPTPPDGHYWRVTPPVFGKYWTVKLKRRHVWWFDTTAQWSVFEPVSDEHANAIRAVKSAGYALCRYREGAGEKKAGLNGLTGYVDAKGRKH